MANTKRGFNIRTRNIEERWGNGRIKTIPPTWGKWIRYPNLQEQGASLQAQEVQRQETLKLKNPVYQSQDWHPVPGHWIGWPQFWPWAKSIQKIRQNNEVNGAIPWSNIQWQLPARHHKWNRGHLHRHRYAYHHWFEHQAPPKRYIDDLHKKKTLMNPSTKSWGIRMSTN